METFNLGAVLFGLLLFAWLGYAVPRIAERRELMGRAQRADASHDTTTGRDLSATARSRRRTREVHAPMADNRLLSRPSDPTRRPRFEEPVRVELESFDEPAPSRSRSLLRGVLVGLTGVSVAGLVLAVTGVIAWWIPVVPAVALVAFVLGLRRAELVRRERARRDASRARRARTLAATAPVEVESAPAEVVEPVPAAPIAQTPTDVERAIARPAPAAREWTPRPVPRPAYALRGDVEDLATRHHAHRESVLGISTAYEDEDVEADEAVREELESAAPAADLDLDAILARRRGA
ncbi:hypothetical protein ACT3TZ_11020 [Brachybacterium sp. AOP25-B2-12]|uniref:hypothetical protein n=1 Tax=Brachybacterium sp. AOP25-B2-12 TaxID=3457710 RepID=UPI004034841E